MWSCMFQSGSFSRDRLTGQLLELPSSWLCFWTQWVCVSWWKKKIPCLSRIWASTHLKWCSCFIPWLSLDWNVSINICVLFFSIRPSSSHEKHVRVSWITMAAEHVYFQHHPLFLLSLVFLFSVVTQAALPLT